ncbi:MAG: laminin G domain-containing protein [Candidatus Schekmanbacteria bacterium]|nr:laminin G domain-containing protein [Candidatus Schekmanbacteria bacterium]
MRIKSLSIILLLVLLLLPSLAAANYDGELDFSRQNGTYQYQASTAAWKMIIDYHERIPDAQDILPFVDTVLVYDTGHDEDDGNWRGIPSALRGDGETAFPQKALIAVNGLNIFIYDMVNLKLWRILSLAGAESPAAAEEKIIRAKANAGLLYLLSAGRDSSLYRIDLAGGIINKLKNNGAYFKADAGAKTPGEYVKENQSALTWTKPYDFNFVASGSGINLVMALGNEGIALLDGKNREIAKMPAPAGEEAIAAAIDHNGKIFSILKNEETSCCTCVKYDLAGQQEPEIIADLFPCDYARINLGYEGQDNILVHTNLGNVLISAEDKEKSYLLEGFDTNSLQMQIRGDIVPPSSSVGVGLSGWSKDSYLAAPDFRMTGSLSTGFWLYISRPQPNSIILDNMHGAKEGWAIGFMDQKYLFIHVGAQEGKGFASQALHYGEWYHVVLVNDSRELRFYINGREMNKSAGAPISVAKGFSIGRRLAEGDERPADPATVFFRPFLYRGVLAAHDVFNLYETERRILEAGESAKFAAMEELEETRFAGLINNHQAVLSWYVKYQPYIFIAGASIIAALALTLLGYAPDDKYLFWLVAAGIPLALLVYAEGFSHPFRSDMYLAYSLFNKFPFTWEGLLKASRFEMFGHRRIMPLSHIMMFLQLKILGLNHLYHHIFQFTLHAVNTILLYIFIRRVLKNRVAAFVGALSFLTFYSHFDIINWTYHSFVVSAGSAFLLGMIMIHKYFDRQHLGWLAGASLLLFYTQLIYESNIFFPLSGLLFFLLLRYQFRADGLSAESTRKGTLVLGTGIFLCYLLFGGYFIYETGRQAKGIAGVEGAGEMQLGQIFSGQNVGYAWDVTKKMIFDLVALKGFGFPSDIRINDILYLNPVRFDREDATFYLASLALFIFFLSVTDMRQPDVAAALFFFLGMALHMFIIALGRGDYAVTQARYAYIPNLFFALILACFIQGKIQSAKNYKWVVMAAVFIMASLNAMKIYRDTNITSGALYELEKYVTEVKDFAGKAQGSLFVDFPVVQKSRKFNLGTDVALDVYFGKDNFLTKDIRKADYIYNQNEGIYKNVSKCIDDKDFTIEFLVYQIFSHNITDFSVVEEKNYQVTITRDSSIVFSGDWIKDGRRLHQKFILSGRIEKGKWIHIVIQREGHKLYMLADGEVARVEDVGDYLLDTGITGSNLIGGFYRGSGSSSFINQLYVAFGKAKYDLLDRGPGEKIITEWIQPW